ncbi:hypothetical protein B9Z19DRAFT_1160242 [Tuber borchii]|uniref:Uncharacterized protein n=1 Tax=Tuber borchii TaxID=42251 RepID=A0A2T6ZF65_TUBBO|nr:hypothetical protein B9Z19DRAFT_1160242 [Tuber borchii]
MPKIFIRAISIPGRALGWLLYYFFLSLALSTHALGLLGSAIMSAPHNVEELLRELFLLSRGWKGPEDDFLNLCSSAASWVDEDFPSRSSFSVSSTLPLSLHAGALSAYGELTADYGSDDESSAYEEHQDGRDFDDDVSDTSSSTYSEIPRDLYFNGAAAARWVLNAGSNASNASLEYELVSEDIYFDQSEAVLGIV